MLSVMAPAGSPTCDCEGEQPYLARLELAEVFHPVLEEYSINLDLYLARSLLAEAFQPGLEQILTSQNTPFSAIIKS